MLLSLEVSTNIMSRILTVYDNVFVPPLPIECHTAGHETVTESVTKRV